MAHAQFSGTRAVLVALGLTLGSQAQAQTTWFVDADAAPGGDGLSWTTAFDDLQPAMELAFQGDEIWVAQGVYTPSVNDPIAGVSTPYFLMPDGVAILGGFVGTETDESQRDPEINETIISGDLLGNDITDVVIDRPAADDPERLGPVLESKLDNAELFFFVDRTGPGTRLDGLTMTGLLKTDTGGFGPATRGGIFVIGAELDIVNCLYIDNLGGANAGIYISRCESVGNADARFADHPCMTGEAAKSQSRVLIEDSMIVDNPRGFTQATSGVVGFGVLVINSELVFRRSLLSLTKVVENSPNNGFGFSSMAGIGTGRIKIEDSQFSNTGIFGALNVNLNVTPGAGEDRNMEVSIKGAIFEDIGPSSNPIIGILGGNITIERCVLANNTNARSPFALVRVAGGPGTTVNVSDSAFIGNRTDTGATLSIFPQETIVTNCTFAANVDGDNDRDQIVNQPPSVALELSSPTAIATNLIIDATTEIPSQVTDSIVAGFADPSRRIIGLNPLFIRPPSDGGDGWGDDPFTPNIDESLNDDFGDLRLRPGSPAIDAGTNDFYTPGDTDLDGNPRLADDPGIPGAFVDLGAYEFQGTTCLADINQNGELEQSDFDAWLDAYTNATARADQNRDGVVTPSDFFAWVSNYNTGCP